MNKKVGLIGLGSMGSMILDQLLKLEILDQRHVYIANRSMEKIDKFIKNYSSLNVCKNNSEVAKECDIIIICVEPVNVPIVLLEIKPYLNERTYLMISTSTVAYEDLYKIYKGKITKFMPTLNSTVRSGITLVCHNEFVTEDEKKYFDVLMSSISEVNEINEEDVNLCHNLTGSFPAIISEIMLEFSKAASKHSRNVSDKEIEHMIMESLKGAINLFTQKNMKFEDTINKVSTKGGITYEGIKIYQEDLPKTFEKAFEVTIKKYDEITANVKEIIDELIK